jgi:hypothetical protein
MFLNKVFLRLTLACSAMALLVPQSAALAADHYAKIPIDTHPSVNQACVFFQLRDVSVADPPVSSEPWFALPKAHTNFAELFAILLSATAGKRTLNVHTSGSVCGTASVITIALY